MKTFALGLAATGFCATAALAQTHIVYGSSTSPASAMLAHGTVPWLEGARDATGGAITFDVQPGGAIVTGDSSLSSLNSWLVDGADIVATYYSSDLPVNALIANFAFLGGDPRATSGAIAELILTECPECLEEYTRWNVVPFGPFATDPYVLACRSPVAELGDLRGLRVRTSGNAWSRLADALGMVPTSLTVNEMYESLQRGTVDCTFAGLSLLETLSLDEVAKHVIDIPVGSLFTPSNLALNVDFWKGLPDDHQQALIASAPNAVASTAYAYLGMALEVRNTATERGLTILPMSDSITTAVETFVASERAAIIAEGERRNIANVEDIVSRFERLVEKWEAIVSEIPAEREALAEALATEVYSRFPNID